MGLKTELTRGAFDTSIAATGGKTAGIGGALAAAASWVSGVNWVTVSGVLVAVGGFIVNLYFNYRRDLREQRESDARIEAMKGRCND